MVLQERVKQGYYDGTEQWEGMGWQDVPTVEDERQQYDLETELPVNSAPEPDTEVAKGPGDPA